MSFEGSLLWAAIFFYGASFLIYLSVLVFKSERSFSLGWNVFIAGFAFHTLAIAVRWIASGHPPVLGRFEHTLAGSWFIAGIFIFLTRKLPSLKNAGVVVSPLALLLLGYGIMKSSPEIAPLPPPYQSYWLWIHVTLAWVAYGAYHVAAGTAILYLLKGKKAGDEKFFLSGLLKKLPEADRMDELVYKLIIYGFIAHIGMLGSGAIWAYGLWGRYWGWDPIETWSLISWLVYGINIHLRATYHWKGRKAAWLAILSLAAIIVTFGGIGFIWGVHTTLL